MEDGETYITRVLANNAFSYSYGTTGSLVIPQEITSIGNYAFSWSKIPQYCFKGPVSEPQGVTQTFQTITPGSDASGAFYGNVKRNFLFVGPNVKIADGYSAKNLIRNGFTGGSGDWTTSLTVILPSRSDNTSWASLTASDIHPRDASKAKLFFYGPGKEFDILMHETSVTMIPTTANALTNVLNWVITFKTKFGLDTKISVTNAIEVGEGLITASKMQYATFNSLMFKAKTQSQLDSLFSVVPATVPLAIDPQDARETLTITTDEKPLPAKAILLGETKYTDVKADVGTDGFRLVACPPHLLIVGSAERGALYGVYELLERFGGCRWYSSWCSQIPRLDRFAVPKTLDDTQTPASAMREPSWWDALEHAAFAARLRVNHRKWRRNEAKYGGDPFRFGGGLGDGHTFNILMPPDKYCDWRISSQMISKMKAKGTQHK